MTTTATRAKSDPRAKRRDETHAQWQARLDAMMLLWRLPSGRYAIRSGTWADALANDHQDEAA